MLMNDQSKKFVLENLPSLLQYWHSKHCPCDLRPKENYSKDGNVVFKPVWPCRFNRKPRNYELYSLVNAENVLEVNYKE